MLRIGPKYKIARRLGNIFEKTQTQKFALREQQRQDRNKKTNRRRSNQSEYGKQLLEKQKLRLTYGLKERHLVNYVKSALSTKQETSAALYELLERRIDSAVYRAGLAKTRRAARQIVSHGHMLHNGRKTTIASVRLKIGDTVQVRDSSQDGTLFATLAVDNKDHKVPTWMESNLKKLQFTVKSLPETPIYDFDLKRIIEYYTR